MIYRYPYTEITNWDQPLPNLLILQDHLGGFFQDSSNAILDHLNKIASTQEKTLSIVYHEILNNTVSVHYPNLEIKFDPGFQDRCNLNSFHKYNTHPEINFKNFVCSFNGSDHVGRKLLVAILEKFGYFINNYCSKNFSHTANKLDGHIYDYVSDDIKFYRKFFISDNSKDFFQSINSFGHVQYQHDQNIYTLENKLTESFLHIVSETMATSYYPFVTEKFLYSVVTRGLFLAYAQPGWHAHVEKYYGFNRYTKLFDYGFDTIQNPVERLVELVTMVSKFSVLSEHDWHDLYLIEQDTIEFNYDHYFSKDYLKCLEPYE
jgi:hypothetical protein